MKRRYLYYLHLVCYVLALAFIMPAIHHPLLFIPAAVFIFSGEVFLFLFYNQP